MRCFLKPLALTLACALTMPMLFPSAACAAPEEAETLDTVVVTASRVPEKLKTVSASMTVIPREEIEKYQQQDLAAVLNRHGFQVDYYAPQGSQSRVTIRGMSTNLFGDDTSSAVLLLVNGRRMGTSNISLIPMVNVERVEIIRGPAAVQYGTSAVGGVVNIITRRGGDLKASVEAGLGSWQGHRLMGEVSGSGYGFDMSGGVSWLGQQNNYKTGSGMVYDNTQTESNIAYNLNAGYTFLKVHRLGINYQGVTVDNVGSAGPTYDFTPRDTYDRSNQSVDFTYDGGYENAGLTWSGRYFLGKYKNNGKGFSPYGDWTDENQNKYQGAQGQVNFSHGPLSLTGGMDWLKYDMDSNGNERMIQKDLGMFALAKLSLLDEKLVVSGGLRYDKHTSDFDGDSDNLYRTTPSVGIAVNPLDWLTVRSNYAESFRVPRPIEVLGYNAGWMTYEGNGDLDPEKGKTWDIGAEVNYKSLNAGLTYFMTDYKNKISGSGTSASGNPMFINLRGKTRFRGLEAKASYDVVEYFDMPFSVRPYATLTYLFKFEAENGGTVPNVSRTQLGYGVEFNHPDWGLDVDLRFVYSGHQKVVDYNSPGPNYKTKKIGGDTTADLYVSKTILSGDAGKLSIKGEIRNIFDVNYYTTDYYPMPGRSFYVGLRYDF